MLRGNAATRREDVCPTYLRYAAGAFVAVVILVLTLAPLASVLVNSWSQRDLESRSRLVYLSIKDYVGRQVAASDSPALAALFEQLTEDEKLLAVGYCDENGKLRFATKLMPASFNCTSLARGETGTFSTIESDGHRILVASFPIAGATAGAGHLAVLHDLSFAESRAAQARLYWALAIAGAGLALVALAALSGIHLSRQWLGAIRQTIAEASGTAPFAPASRHAAPLLGASFGRWCAICSVLRLWRRESKSSGHHRPCACCSDKNSPMPRFWSCPTASRTSTTKRPAALKCKFPPADWLQPWSRSCALAAAHGSRMAAGRLTGKPSMLPIVSLSRPRHRRINCGVSG